jgi:Spy/CpxP family protein refolding chaperone
MKPFHAARVAIAGLGLFVLAGSAVAQPHMHHRGPGDVAMAIAAVKGQLNLNTSQQQMWDSAMAASRSARQSARANFASLHDAAAAELAKADPDLAALAALGDDVQARNAALRRQARDAWLALYATFTPDQKVVVRDVLRQKMARMERLREKFREHHGGRG